MSEQQPESAFPVFKPKFFVKIMKPAYEDLPAHAKKAVAAEAFRKDRKLFRVRLVGFCIIIFTAICLAKAVLSGEDERTGRGFLSGLFAVGFYWMFFHAVIEPRIMRYWDRKNAKGARS